MIKFSTCYFVCKPENSKYRLEFRILKDMGDIVTLSETRPELIQRIVEAFGIYFKPGENIACTEDLPSGDLIDPFFAIIDGIWEEITEETYQNCRMGLYSKKELLEKFRDVYKRWGFLS